MSSSEIKKLEKAIAGAVSKNQLDVALDFYTELGELYCGLEDRLMIYKKAYKIARQIPYGNAKIGVKNNLFFVLRKLAEIYAEMGELKAAVKYSEELVNFSVDLNDPCFLQKAYHVGSWVFQVCSGGNEDLLIKATNLAKKSMVIIRDRGDEIDRTMREHKSDDLCDKRRSALNQLMGDIYRDRGDNEKARIHFEAASQYRGLDKEPDLYFLILKALHGSTDDAEERLRNAKKMLVVARKCENRALKSANESEAEFWCTVDQLKIMKSVAEEDLQKSMCELHRVINNKDTSDEIVELGKRATITLYKVLQRLKFVNGIQGSNPDDDERKAKIYEKCADSLGDPELQFYNLALFYYTKMRRLAKNPKTVRNSLISIAETNMDLQNFPEAVRTYDEVIEAEQDMDLPDNELLETMCSKAICFSKLKSADFNDKWKQFLRIERKIDKKSPIWRVYLEAAVKFLEDNMDESQAVDLLETYRSILDSVPECESEEKEEIESTDEFDSMSDEYLLRKIQKEAEFFNDIEQRRARVNVRNRNGETDLHLACKTNNLKLVKLLIEKCGYDVNAVDNGGWTPLSEAVDYEQVEILKYLITKGANVNTRSMEGLEGEGLLTKGGRTPLMEACEKGHAAMIEVLLKGKADTCVLSDANWRASDFLEQFLKNNPDCEDEPKLKSFLKFMRVEESKRHAQKVSLKKDVYQMKLSTDRKPMKPHVEIDEDKRNLLEYEAALNRFGRVTKTKDSVLDSAMASHVVEENLNDPNFLEDDLEDDEILNADSMEVLIGKKKKIMSGLDSGDVEEINLDREPLSEITVRNEEISSTVEKPRIWKRKTPIEKWLDNEPLTKRMSLGFVISKNEDSKTIATKSSGSGSGSKRSNLSSRTGFSATSGSSASSGSTIELEARIIDAVTRLEIKKFKQVKASRNSTVEEIVKVHICRELELSGLDSYSQLVAVKDHSTVSMTTVLYSLLPENCFSKTFSMDFVIYDWIPPSPEALFKCLQINCNLKILAAVNQAVATRILDLSSCDPNCVKNLVIFFKSILFLFGREIGDYPTLKKIILNGLRINLSDEKNLAEIFIKIFDFIEKFDVGNFVMTDNFLNLLTVSSMTNLTEICLKKGNFKMDTVVIFLKKLSNLRKLDMFSIDWIGEPQPVENLIEVICQMPNLEQLNLAYFNSLNNLHIQDILKSCKKLKFLDISETKLTDFPVELATYLEYLSIQGTAIDVNEEFIEKISKISQLCFINFSKTNFSFVFLEKLAMGRSRLEVKAYGVTGTYNPRSLAYALERISKTCNIRVDIGIPKANEVIRMAPHLKQFFVLPGQK